MEPINPARQLLIKWRDHISNVYDRRGRSSIYHYDDLHTCHGCGEGDRLITDGLCSFCQHEYEMEINDLKTREGIKKHEED